MTADFRPEGTFYTHFEDLDALTAAVADELAAAFDDLIQPARVAIADPSTASLSAATRSSKSARCSCWAHVVTPMARFHPAIGEGRAAALLEDLRRALKDVAGPAPCLELALEIVVGLMSQALSAFAEQVGFPL